MFSRSRRLIYPLNGGRRMRHIGAKAQQLTALLDLGVPVPVTFVCPWDVHARYQAGETDLLERLSVELAGKLDPAWSWAVRSSASVEDGAGHSFAGQFASLLNVSGRDELVQAIRCVWDSASAPSLRPYLKRIGLHDAPKMAVIIQEMVAPVASGVAFSKNPITGMDEVIVEAVEGLGSALMQDGCTPQRWVNKWGQWMVEPYDSKVDQGVIQEVVRQTVRIARAVRRPVDLEWVYDGQDVYWVQLRPITTLEGVNVYSNRISREVMPGLIKPLVWSVNVALVNSAWIQVFEELVGATGLQPDDLARSFYHRAYFNMGAIGRIFAALGMPQETLELLMGVEGGEQRPRFRPSIQALRHLPRLARLVAGKLRFDREIESLLPVAQDVNRRFAARSLEELDARELLGEIDRLFVANQRLAYTNVVGPLLMYAYHALLRRQLAQVGIELETFDVMQGLADGQAYDPVTQLAELHRQYQALGRAEQQRLQVEGPAALEGTPGLEPLQQAYASFMARFGHYSSSGNDFSQVPWREQPDLVLQMIMDYRAPAGMAEGIGWDDLPRSVQRRRLLRFAFFRARQYRGYREAINYQYTYGYGLFRSYFLALGARLVNRGLLSRPEDVFYLTWAEARDLVEAGAKAQPLRKLVEKRRESVLAARDVILPDIIYGDQPPPPGMAVPATQRLSGVPTSRGYYQGRVRVVQSVEQFDQVEPGRVIVIPYSDVSWTPLIARAGAVVAESGGILSHSSIVAREYNLPAVVSVTAACRLLADHMLVTVDGFKGEIVIHDN